MRHLTPLILLLGASAGTAAAAPPAPPEAETAVAAEGFEELVAAYAEAVAEWTATFKATEDLRERAALRKSHPAIAHWERFQALADGGEGRALLWMIEHAKDRGLRGDEASEAKGEMYGRLFADHLQAAWFGDVVSRVPRDAKDLGLEDAARLLGGAREGATDATVRGLATLALAKVYDSGSDQDKAKAKALLEEFERNNIAVGAQAIDFRGSTIDGHEFRLSDYRGKVVLVDFYGFW